MAPQCDLTKGNIMCNWLCMKSCLCFMWSWVSPVCDITYSRYQANYHKALTWFLLCSCSCATFPYYICNQPETCDVVMSALTTLMKCRLIEENGNSLSGSESGALRALGEPWNCLCMHLSLATPCFFGYGLVGLLAWWKWERSDGSLCPS